MINIFIINNKSLFVFTDIIIKGLLKVIRYNKKPKIIPIKIYALISPWLNFKMEYTIIIELVIQKQISSKIVKKSFVLNVFLSILKKSKIMPIKNPDNMKIKKTYDWLNIYTPYLKILLNIDVFSELVFLSE